MTTAFLVRKRLRPARQPRPFMRAPSTGPSSSPPSPGRAASPPPWPSAWPPPSSSTPSSCAPSSSRPSSTYPAARTGGCPAGWTESSRPCPSNPPPNRLPRPARHPPARSRTARQPSSGPPADPPAQHHQQGRAADSGTHPCHQVTRVARGRAATASRAGSRRVTWQLAVQNGLACPGYRAELARQGPAQLPPLGRAGPEKRCLALRECQPPAGPAPPHRPSSVEERQQ